MENREKYRTRLLPHWDFGDVVQTITYRLGDSIPPTVYQQFLDLTDLLPPESQNRQKRQLVENWIDLGEVEFIEGNCQYFWAAPVNRPDEVQNVYVDRILVVH